MHCISKLKITFSNGKYPGAVCSWNYFRIYKKKTCIEPWRKCTQFYRKRFRNTRYRKVDEKKTNNNPLNVLRTDIPEFSNDFVQCFYQICPFYRIYMQYLHIVYDQIVEGCILCSLILFNYRPSIFIVFFFK